MDKTGRNDPCPCGSGKKYKKCCLPKHQAAQRQQLAQRQVERDQHAAAHRSRLSEMRAELAARLAGIVPAEDDDPLTVASNAVFDLVDAGKLDEAEHAARDLLVRFPDVHDGYDRLGMVHQAEAKTSRPPIATARSSRSFANIPTITTTPLPMSSSSWSLSSTRPPA